jgi:hypothetical protein
MPISQSIMCRDFRRTHYIDWRQARNFRNAIHYADKRLVEFGRPLNTFATINFGHIACPPEAVSAIFEKLRDNHFVRWLRYGTSDLSYYVWVIENAGGNTHVHWVLHLPKSLRAAFEIKIAEWLGRVAGTITCRESAIKIQTVTNLRGLGLYLLKGMDPRYAARFGVKHVPQGLVYGKRCGISKSLGPASRTELRQGARSRFNPAPTLRSPNVEEGVFRVLAGASQLKWGIRGKRGSIRI